VVDKSVMKQNSTRIRLGKALAKHARVTKKNFWEDASEGVLASRKNRPVVSIDTISKNSKDGTKIVVPGKVLASGSIDHKVTVAALCFSEGARKKIAASGGQCMSLSDFMESSKDVKGVLVLG
jgi:large subunit ribosomal protein L18e